MFLSNKTLQLNYNDLRGEIDTKIELIESLTYKYKQYDNLIKEKDEEMKKFRNDYSEL